MYTVLICDDQPDIVNALKIYLTPEGYRLLTAYTGLEAVELARREELSLILMDVMMPGMDGITATARIREFSNVPIIFLTAKADLSSKVKGLKEGAEDYIVKPFEMLEVMVRLEKVLERHGSTQEQLQIDDVIIDTVSHTVTKNGEEIYLKPMEYNCLMMFVKSPNKALSREQLLSGLWGVEFEGETRTVDAHVGRIRKKLGWQNRIKTIPRIGYRLEVEF